MHVLAKWTKVDFLLLLIELIFKFSTRADARTSGDCIWNGRSVDRVFKCAENCSFTLTEILASPCVVTFRKERSSEVPDYQKGKYCLQITRKKRDG